MGGDLAHPHDAEAERLSDQSGWCAPAGVYVSASLKEEFGIAILEAMGSGLVVVAPVEGGPATYVEDGVTGFLVDTGSPSALAQGVASALDLAAAPDAPERAEHATRLVTERQHHTWPARHHHEVDHDAVVISLTTPAPVSPLATAGATP